MISLSDDVIFTLSLSQAKRQQRKLNFLITQTELYAHFMSGKASVGGPGGDVAQEEILRKLEDTGAQRQIDIGGGVMVNMGHEDYGMNSSLNFQESLLIFACSYITFVCFHDC